MCVLILLIPRDRLKREFVEATGLSEEESTNEMPLRIASIDVCVIVNGIALYYVLGTLDREGKAVFINSIQGLGEMGA